MWIDPEHLKIHVPLPHLSYRHPHAPAGVAEGAVHFRRLPTSAPAFFTIDTTERTVNKTTREAQMLMPEEGARVGNNISLGGSERRRRRRTGVCVFEPTATKSAGNHQVLLTQRMAITASLQCSLTAASTQVCLPLLLYNMGEQ